MRRCQPLSVFIWTVLLAVFPVYGAQTTPFDVNREFKEARTHFSTFHPFVFDASNHNFGCNACTE